MLPVPACQSGRILSGPTLNAGLTWDKHVKLCVKARGGTGGTLVLSSTCFNPRLHLGSTLPFFLSFFLFTLRYNIRIDDSEIMSSSLVLNNIAAYQCFVSRRKTREFFIRCRGRSIVVWCRQPVGVFYTLNTRIAVSKVIILIRNMHL